MSDFAQEEPQLPRPEPAEPPLISDSPQAEQGADPTLATLTREGVPDPDEQIALRTHVQHIDGGGTLHHFAIVPRAEVDADAPDPYELRYFRSLPLPNGTLQADDYPVMPLPDERPESAWALPALEDALQTGDVFMAQQLAHDVADAYGQTFPEPHDLPALDPRPQYYFGYTVSPNEQPALEAVKTWIDGSERRFDTLLLGEYDTFDAVAVDESKLETVLDKQGIEAAMHAAETLAVANGTLDPQRADGRIFFDDDAPPDPFTTTRQAELDAPQREARHWFEGELLERTAEPLAPLDPSVNYGLDVHSPDEHTLQLNVEKYWQQPDGALGVETLTLREYPLEEHAAAQRDFLDLHAEHREHGLEAAMHAAETLAVAHGTLDPLRADGRLFTDDAAPPDPFTPQRQAELDAAPLAWRLDVLPAHDPDGQPLGHALHLLAFDTPDPADTDAPTRHIPLAHFHDPADAERLRADFPRYVLPGVLEAHELGEAIAQQEGLPAQWEPLTDAAQADYQRGALAVTVSLGDWRPQGRDAEYEARIEAEGIYTDPLHHTVEGMNDNTILF